MYRPYSCLLILLFLSGCASVDGDRLSKASSDLLERTGQVMKKIVNPQTPNSYQGEQRALFDQPYIDPLTEYLAEHYLNYYQILNLIENFNKISHVNSH